MCFLSGRVTVALKMLKKMEMLSIALELEESIYIGYLENDGVVCRDRLVKIDDKMICKITLFDKRGNHVFYLKIKISRE